VDVDAWNSWQPPSGYSWRQIYGNSSAVHDDSFRYQVPIEGPTNIQLSYNEGGHRYESAYAIDWGTRLSEPVYAMRAGQVVRVIENNTDKCASPDPSNCTFPADNNLIFVLHSDNTIAEYDHFEFNGSAVREGQFVRERDLLGFAGVTGNAPRPQTHIQLFKPMPYPVGNRFITPIRILFDGVSTNATVAVSAAGFIPRTNESYQWIGEPQIIRRFEQGLSGKKSSFVRWNDPPEGDLITRYTMQWRKAGAPTVTTAFAFPPAVSFQIVNLTCDTTYTAYITARNPFGLGRQAKTTVVTSLC